ncbi:MAG: hypothetical protein ACKVII_15640 [Planctomycetales bacterium]
MLRPVILGVVCLVARSGFAADVVAPLVDGNSVVRGPLGDSEIVIRTTSRLAGAIDSLTWNGQEFINSADHGRQLQSASNLDFGSKMTPESFNPTEAGSRLDGAGKTSTSRLLHLIADGNRLQTTNQMAFWLAPGQKSGGVHLAKNTTTLSNHLLTKRVQIGWKDLPNVISYDVTFGLPINEHHRYAQFEVVTGYMPPEFETFLKFNPESGDFEPLTDGPGEQKWPVALSTADGQFAMGIYTSHRPGQNWTGPGYGRFRFPPQKVVKWNCVFRYRVSGSVPAGDYSFRTFVIVGTREMVRSAMRRLHKEPVSLPGQPAGT